MASKYRHFRRDVDSGSGSGSDGESQITVAAAASTSTVFLTKKDEKDSSTIKINEAPVPVRTRSGSTGTKPTRPPMKRYILRAILSTVLPITLTIYYILTYLRWLRYPENSGEAWRTTGYLDDGETVSYSWFVLAAFALNLGTYALAGSISSMVMTKDWQPRNARRLLKVAADSYADPGSWAGIPVGIVKHKKLGAGNNGRLWNFLAVISVTGFVAWPLTGLTMQTGDGYAVGVNSGPKGGNVLGRNATTFLSMGGSPLAKIRRPDLTLVNAASRLKAGREIRLPWGQLYGSANSRQRFNTTGNNQMPLDGSDPIFLPVQSEAPIVAEQTFGLLIRYNCSVVRSTSEFQILNQRRPVNVSRFDVGLGYAVGHPSNGSSILVIQKANNISDAGFNLRPAMEVGVNLPLSHLGVGEYWTQPSPDSYTNNYTSEYNTRGINNPLILEVALWQSIHNFYTTRDDIVYQDVDSEYELKDLRGIYPDRVTNLVNFTDGSTHVWPPGKAIGCRCFAASDLGYADIDGTAATFSNFRVMNGTLDVMGAALKVKTFERGFLQLLTGVVQEEYFFGGDDVSSDVRRFVSLAFTTNEDWYTTLWGSLGLLWEYTEGYAYYTVSTSVIQAQQLREILVRMSTAYALELMYDGKLGGDINAASWNWFNPNVIVARKAKVLNRGVVPPEIVLAMLAVWALGICIPAILYQFRRRWVDKLDVFSMFVLGVSRPEGVRPGDLQGKGKNKLENLPGRIGNVTTGQGGAVGLVRGSAPSAQP
ncbi:hypothetical protein TWF281_001372 [Arthrobotrys megalospora]